MGLLHAWGLITGGPGGLSAEVYGIFLSNTFWGDMSPDPARKLVGFGHSGLLPQTINPG